MQLRLKLPSGTVGLGILCGALLAPPAWADQFHYANVLVGTRAVGLGGAFGAVSDDASGVYYNPAGLAFALSNDIQGSANAFYKKKTTYLKTIGNDSFEEKSEGSLTPFFGGLQKLDRYVEGLVFAFGVYYTDGDLKDQETLIEGKTVGSTKIDRYHRTSNARAGTYYAGAAVGYRPVPNLAIGLGLNYYASDELVQEYQYAKQSLMLDPSTPGWRILTSNVRERLAVYGMQPVLGVQAALPAGFAVGLTVKKGMIASQRYDSVSETETVYLSDAQNNDIEASGAVATPRQAGENISTTKSKKPIGDLPIESRLGLAWFASPTILWALDFIYYSAVTNGDKAIDPAGLKARYNREAVLNYATGIEWYLAPSFPLRFGLFTNNDARPKVAEGTPNAAAGAVCGGTTDAGKTFTKKYCGQPDHIDYLGGSLFIAWVQPNSQISGGLVMQQGSGKAQKLGDYQVQDVKSQQYQFAFSATHNL